MPHDWAQEWKDRENEVRKRREAAELRRRNELTIAHQVVIQLWREVYCIHVLQLPETDQLQDGCAKPQT
jgi:hypothetical protein